MVDASALRDAAEGLRSYRAWLSQVASRHESFASQLDGQMDELAQAWRSPFGRRHLAEGRRIAARHRRVVAPLREAVGATRTLASVASTLATRLQSLQTQREQLQGQVWRARATAAAAAAVPVGGGITGGVAEATNRVAQLEAQLRTVDRRIAEAQAEWDADCRTLRAQLEPTVAIVSPESDIRTEAIGFALMQLGGPPGSWSRVPHGDAWFDALVAARMADPTGAHEVVLRAAAERLLGDLDARLIAQLQDGRFEPGTLDALEGALAAHPMVGVVLLERLGPVGLGTLPYAVESRGAAWLPSGYHAEGYGLSEYLADGNRLVDLLATTLSAASHRDELDPGFFDELVAVADTEPGAAFGLSLLMHRGERFEPGAALTLADGLYAIERAEGPHAWMHRAELGRGLPDLLDTVSRFDVMTGVSAMLARDATAAQAFLLGDDPGGDSRVTWLTTNRDWGFEGGAAYGAMVQAATTQLRDLDGEGSPGWRSAQITTEFLAALPARREGDLVVSYDVPDGFKAPIGTILGTYFHDLDRRPEPDFRVRTTISSLLPEDRQAYGIRVPQESVRALLDAVIDDPDAYRSILAGQYALMHAQLDHVTDLDGDHLREPEALLDQLVRQAATVGLVDDVLRQRNIEDAAAYDAHAASLARLGASAVRTVPLPGGPVTGFAVGQVADAIAGTVSPDTIVVEQVRADRTSMMVEHTVRLEITAALLAAGWFDDGGPYAEHHPDRTVPELAHATHRDRAELTFLDGDGRLRPHDQLTDRQRELFASWERQGLNDLDALTVVEDRFADARNDYAR